MPTTATLLVVFGTLRAWAIVVSTFADSYACEYSLRRAIVGDGPLWPPSAELFIRNLARGGHGGRPLQLLRQ